MVEGLEVTIKYKGPKHLRVASSTLAHNAKTAILKKDLAHLRVHAPSQRNVRRVNGAFILHWPTASNSTSSENFSAPDTLYTRWMKLAGEDPESRSLRETLSIESITLTQDGRTIGPNSGEGPPTSPTTTLTPTEVLNLPPAERDRERPIWPLPKRPLSSGERSPSPIRRKLGETAPHTSTDTPNGCLQSRSDDHSAFSRATTTSDPNPSAIEAPTGNNPETLNSAQQGMNPESSNASQIPQEPAKAKPTIIPPPRVPRGPRSALPKSPSPAGHNHSMSHASDKETVNWLDRELWDIHREMTALQAREKNILEELNRLGARPGTPSSETSSGGGRDGRCLFYSVGRMLIHAGADIETRLARAEEELRKERAGRLRAERALEDVERECKAPFIVPALFQAFMNISELSS